MTMSTPCQTVLDTLPCATWTATSDGRVDWVNAEARRLFGSGIDGTRGLPDWVRLVHPGDFARAERAWQSAIASGDSYDVPMRLLSAVTQRYRWYQCRAHRVVDGAGQSRWIGLNVDVDAMLRGVETQAASLERAQIERERLRGVFANCPVAITLYQGPDHRIAMMNEANRRIIGGRDLEGQALAEAFPEIVSQGLVDILDRVLATGEPFEASEFEIQFDRYGDGAIAIGYFSFSLLAMRDADGHVHGVLSSAVDVTEQVEARRALARLAAEREAVLAQLADGLVLTDASGRITFVNDHARELHGVAELDVMPDAYSEVYSLLREDGSPYPSEELPLARAVRDGCVVTAARWRIRRPDGNVVLVEGDARPVVDAGGERLGAVLTLRRIG